MTEKKMIIIDDEVLNADGVRMLIERSKLPVSVEKTFYSSIEALEYLKTESVDIVLTDINMPELDGLELIAKLKEMESTASILIVTGFGSLEYAKEAMRYGVRHFLQKPCSPLELSDSILECIEEAEAHKSNSFLRNKQLIEKAIFEGKSNYKEKIENFSIIMYPDTLYSELHNKITELLSDLNLKYEISNIKGTILYYIFSSTDFTNRIYSFYSESSAIIYIAMRQNLNIISESFELGIQSFYKGFYSENIKVIVQDQVIKKNIKQIDINEEIKKIRFLIMNNEIYAGLEASLEILENFKISMEDPQIPKRIVQEVYEILSRNSKIAINAKVLNHIEEAKKISSLFEITREIFREYMDDKTILEENESISASINLVIERYFDDTNLSLKWISKNLIFLHPEYLGKVYYKETGKKFSIVLTEHRMRKAKEYLIKGYRVYEVASMVGYENNPDYFGQVFKREFRCTPKKFIEKYNKNMCL